MANEFRPYEPDQPYLLPQLPREWLPEGHLALFLMDVVNQLDLGPILSRYHGGRGDIRTWVQDEVRERFGTSDARSAWAPPTRC